MLKEYQVIAGQIDSAPNIRWWKMRDIQIAHFSNILDETAAFDRDEDHFGFFCDDLGRDLDHNACVRLRGFVAAIVERDHIAGSAACVQLKLIRTDCWRRIAQMIIHMVAPVFAFCFIVRDICNRVRKCKMGVVDREIKIPASCGFCKCAECCGAADRVVCWVCAAVSCSHVQCLALEQHDITHPEFLGRAECIQIPGIRSDEHDPVRDRRRGHDVVASIVAPSHGTIGCVQCVHRTISGIDPEVDRIMSNSRR